MNFLDTEILLMYFSRLSLAFYSTVYCSSELNYIISESMLVLRKIFFQNEIDILKTKKNNE